MVCSSARVDGLAKREMTATETTEHFEKRPDFLYYRHVTFAKIGKKFESADAGQQRPILVSIYPLPGTNILAVYQNISL